MDVHPPLYYFIVKFFVFLGHFLHLPFSDIYIAKISSATPILLLMIFSWKYLRRDIGELAAGLFSLSLIIMPQFIFYLNDIRMYSWGMLFVTLAYYMAYRISLDGSYKNYALFIFFTVLGIYTQYYCAVALFGVYFVLFTYLSLKNRVNKVKKLVISGIISILSFMPWLSILLHQVNNVSSNYWIPGFDSQLLFFIFWNLLISRVNSEFVDLTLNNGVQWEGLILLVLLVILFGFCAKYLFRGGVSLNSLKTRLCKLNFLTFGALIILSEIILGVLISAMIGRPILHPRYLFIGFALFWLSVCIILSRTYHLKSKSIFVLAMVLFLISGGLNTYYSLTQIITNQEATHDMYDVLNLIDPDDLIVDDNLAVAGYRELFVHHPDENTYIGQLSVFWEPVFLCIYESQHNMSVFKGDIAQRVNNALKSGHKVWINSYIRDNKDYYRIFDPSDYIDGSNYHVKFYKIRHGGKNTFYPNFILEIIPN